MIVVELRIPYSFTHDRATLSWRDMQFGLSNGFLDPQAPIDKAVEEIVEHDAPSPDILELASASRSDPMAHLVARLAEVEPDCSEKDPRAVWLYLVLAWLYEHRAGNPDPLQTVEEIYSDFGYPEDIASFVRYMPAGDPDLGSCEANELRMFERWKQYLDDAARIHHVRRIRLGADPL